MEQRFLGASGLSVSSFSLGTMTFGGRGRHAAMGGLGVEQARRFIDIAMEHGVTLFDTADIYSDGLSEQVLGSALNGRRQSVQIATKAYSRMGPGANDVGLSRHHLIEACDASLRRLKTDYIDLYQAHSMDSITPMEETLGAFDYLAAVRSVTPAQWGLNWVRCKPGVDTVILGARTEEQLRDDLSAVAWELSAEEMACLDSASAVPDSYPYWAKQNWAAARNPRLPSRRTPCRDVPASENSTR